MLGLISGGGSALLALPPDGITLADKQAINRALLSCGAHIAEMNCVRKHLSAIKGGRLAVAAAPARVVTLIISDVPGDDLSVIASGPTVPDATTRADALAVLTKYGIEIPAAVLRHLDNAVAETPKPGDPRLANVANILIATPQKSAGGRGQGRARRRIGAHDPRQCDRGRGARCRHRSCRHRAAVRRLGAAARNPLRAHLGRRDHRHRARQRPGRPQCRVSAQPCDRADGRNGIWALAADTDGIDGSEDNAGAIIDPDTLRRAKRAGIDVKARLADNDAYTVFAALDDLVVTGPTLTNVNDFRAILVTKRN